MNEIIQALETIKTDIDIAYPKYCQVTEEICENVRELLLTDFDCIFSDTKKLRIVYSYLADTLEFAFRQNGKKYYLKAVLQIYLNKDISEYLFNALQSEAGKLSKTLTRIKYEITYWQKDAANDKLFLNKVLKCIE